MQRGTFIGLDIGRSSAKAAWIRARGDRPAVVRCEHVRLPADARESREVLKSWVRKCGLANAPVVIGLPGQHCVFQPVSIAAADTRAMDQVASMEVLQFNEMAQETMAYAWAPCVQQERERRLLLAMARMSLVNGLLAAARETGVRVVDAVPVPAAVYSWAVAHEPAHAEPYMYVNIGHSTTEAAFGAGGGILFARAFGSGGQMFTDAYGRAMGIQSALADAAKIKDGSLSGQGPGSAALRAAVDVWLSELRACISVYRSVYADKAMQPARIVLSGRGAQLHGLREHLASQLGIEVVEQGGAPAGSESPSLYSVACGLAWCGLSESSSRLSLLPPSVRDELMFRRQKPFWFGAGVAASLILGVSLAGGYLDFKRKETLLEEKKTSLSRRQALVSEIENIENGTAAMFSMAGPVEALVRNGPLMRDLITALSESLSQDDWITLVCDSESYFAYQPPGADAGAKGMRDLRRRDTRRANPAVPEDNFERVVIEGYTGSRSLSRVKALIAELTGREFVASADLLGDDQLVGGADGSPESVQRFVIDARMKRK